MVEFARRVRRFRAPLGDGYGRRVALVSIQTLLVLMMFCFGAVDAPAEVKKGTIGILPFEINAVKSFKHLREGLQKMLSFRMEQNGFEAIRPETINKDPLVFSKGLENKVLVSLGNRLKAQWMVKGSLTQIGDKGSIDLKVVDVSGKKMPFLFFRWSKIWTRSPSR